MAHTGGFAPGVRSKSLRELQIPMSDDERERGLAAIEAARLFQKKLLAARHGKPFAPGYYLIGEGRSEGP
jgi:hypothetical protein